MNNLQKLCTVLVLVLALSSATLAGTIDCPGITQPPPPEGTTSQTQSDAVSDSTITEALLTLIESVLLVP